MDTAIADAVLPAVQALALASARWMGCALFLPLLGRRHLAGLQRAAVCLALGLPQVGLIWTQLQGRPHAPVFLMLAGLKEVGIGCLIGVLLAVPFWSFVGAFTLVDNQRGATLAQAANPSIQQDASLLGELAERALIAILVDAAMFVPALEIVAGSYAGWPALSLLPDGAWLQGPQATRIAAELMGGVVAYAGPFLLLLILVEFGFAVSSLVVRGLDVYQVAMPVRSLSVLACVALSAHLLLGQATEGIARWWQQWAAAWPPGG